MEKEDDKLFKRDICCFDFRSNFLVSISFLINIGKEMSLPGFRTWGCIHASSGNEFVFSESELFPSRVDSVRSETNNSRSEWSPFEV